MRIKELDNEIGVVVGGELRAFPLRLALGTIFAGTETGEVVDAFVREVNNIHGYVLHLRKQKLKKAD